MLGPIDNDEVLSKQVGKVSRLLKNYYIFAFIIIQQYKQDNCLKKLGASFSCLNSSTNPYQKSTQRPKLVYSVASRLNRSLWRYNGIMSNLFSDTQPEPEAILIELLRHAPPWRKLEMVDPLNQSVKLSVMTDLRQRSPDESEVKLHR